MKQGITYHRSNRGQSGRSFAHRVEVYIRHFFMHEEIRKRAEKEDQKKKKKTK